MKPASVVATFGHAVIYIHAQCAKEDLTLRKLSGDSKLKELQMPGKKKRHMPGNLVAIAMRAENNEERFHWRERTAAAFEEKYSKRRANLKRSRGGKSCAGRKSDLDWSRSTVAGEEKELVSFRRSLSEVEESHSWRVAMSRFTRL